MDKVQNPNINNNNNDDDNNNNNNINERIAETLYSLGTWFVSGVYV